MKLFSCNDPGERARGLRAACDAVDDGGLVVLPTDTVYGIGCAAHDRTAVVSLLAAKGRGPDMPVPVLVGSLAQVEDIVPALPEGVEELIAKFWPGALSIVLRHVPELRWDLGETHGTVMLRMPAHELAIELLDAAGPMAVSSANRSGSPAATTVHEARAQLGDSVDVYLDGGSTPGPVPSTILDLAHERPRLLREGLISRHDISGLLGVAL
jgi:tRNA threonylcarbamoyl adenosine modification protein (Sua5/YciO/YrdC/YwlC family)